jgi:Flp pilus assembly protein TadB
MARRATLRASDEDRDRIAERLREAAAEGRLLAHELEHRLTIALRARTYGELDAVVSDLPVRRSRSTPTRWVRPTLALAIAIPVALAVIAVVLFILTSIFALWILWVLFGWMWFGRRRGSMHARRRGRLAQPRPRH